MTASDSYSYEFGHCFAPLLYIGNGLYTDKCCLESEEHTLICKTAVKSGWDDSYLIIKGHWFCEGITGYKSMSRINVSGISCTHTDKYVIILTMAI